MFVATSIQNKITDSVDDIAFFRLTNLTYM